MNSLVKKNVLIVIILFATASASGAIVDTFPFTNSNKWKTRIVFHDGTMLNGFASGSTDSTITLIIPRTDTLGQKMIATIPFRDIQKIRMRDGNKLTKGAKILGGVGVGFLLGFLLGGKDCSDPYSDCSFFESIFANQSFNGALRMGGVFGGIGLIFALADGERVTFKFKLGKDNKSKIKMPTF